MDTNKMKAVCTLILALGGVVSLVYTVEKYFAKSSDFVDLEERVDIKVKDDQIQFQEQQIQQMEQYRIFRQKEPMPEYTPMEENAVKSAVERLEKLKEEKEEAQERYRERR